MEIVNPHNCCSDCIQGKHFACVHRINDGAVDAEDFISVGERCDCPCAEIEGTPTELASWLVQLIGENPIDQVWLRSLVVIAFEQANPTLAPPEVLVTNQQLTKAIRLLCQVRGETVEDYLRGLTRHDLRLLSESVKEILELEAW
jgi:hypothetical protein